MKKPGRVGDSPFVGSGFYADSEVGGATATGLGEDLMKGCISYEIVRLMKEGLTPQEACEKAVNDLDASLKKRRTFICCCDEQQGGIWMCYKYRWILFLRCDK